MDNKKATQPIAVIWRHRRENKKKCSLKGLEKRDDFRFFSYPTESLPFLPGYLFLDVDAPPLSPHETFPGLILFDGTWRYVEKMKQAVQERGEWIRRSLPLNCQTAYPRRQDDCSDPTRGLASIEAIYVAFTLLGWDTKDLLDNYHWKEVFLHNNGWEKQ